MGLIEFAPSPSGPAHIGTLRTYAVAWKMAKEQNKKINIRFDVPNEHGRLLSGDSKADFLNDLHDLNMYPDSFINNTVTFDVANFEYGDILEIKDGYLMRDPAQGRGVLVIDPTYETRKEVRFLYRLEQTPAKIVFAPYIELSKQLNYDIITKTHPANIYIQGFASSDFCDSFYLAYKTENTTNWVLSDPVNSLISCVLRKVDTVVRGINYCCIRDIAEIPCAKYFGINLYDQKVCAMVVSGGNMLSKSQLKKDDIGTISWAIKEFGVRQVRDGILSSIKKTEPETIDIKDVFHGGRISKDFAVAML